MRGPIPLTLAIGILALIAGIWLALRVLGPGLPGGASPPALATGTLLPQRRALEPFALTDTTGASFTEASLREHWTLLAFGYASCPDVCPMLLATFRDVHRHLAEHQLAGQVRFMFVSVDPERDDLQRLRDYVTYFNPAFVGATGPHAELQRLARQLGVLYQRTAEGQSALGYLVDHSAALLLIDPQGRFTAVFSAPHDAPALAADIGTLLGRR